MELPRLEPLWNKYLKEGLAVVAIEAFRDREGALQFIQENNLTYHFLENGEGDEEVVSNLFGVNGFPTSFLIDREGRVVYSHVGFDEGDEVKIEKEIKSLLKAGRISD